MKRVVILKDGTRFVWTDRLMLTEHGNPVVSFYDLSLATRDEMEHIKRNPHDDTLLSTIHTRKNLVR